METTWIYTALGAVMFWFAVFGFLGFCVYMTWWEFKGKDLAKPKAVKIKVGTFLILTIEDCGRWVVTVFNCTTRRKVFRQEFKNRRAALRKRKNIIEVLRKYQHYTPND